MPSSRDEASPARPNADAACIFPFGIVALQLRTAVSSSLMLAWQEEAFVSECLQGLEAGPSRWPCSLAARSLRHVQEMLMDGYRCLI